MTVPYTFATATSAIPLSQLDSNFATAITLGSTALYLGNTTTTIAGLTLTSPTLTTPALGTPASGNLSNCTGIPASGVTGVLPVANGGTGVTTSTGTGNVVLSTSPTLVTPILGTPTSVTLTNGTGLPLTTGVTGTLGTTNGGTGLTSFTANGVVYASSTSALTTGSALTFDGTNLALGTPALAARVMSVRGRAAFIAPSNDSQLAIYSDGVTNGLYSTYNSTGSYLPMTFFINDAEQMRLTSTGLGIGTSSPAYKLDVVGNAGIARIQSTGSGQNSQLNLQSTAATWSIGQNITLTSTGTLEFYNGSTRLQLDSSGNLGLGVTPSAWVTTGASRGMQFGRAGSIFYSTDQALATFGNNNYQDGATTFKYLTSGYAQRYAQSDYEGSHKWFTAPSGTAGNAITFTQAMTLDASGNLGVGTTTTSGARLTVMGASGGIILDDGNGRKLKFDPPGSINSNVAFIGTTTPHALRINSGTVTNEGTLIFSTENTERARIDSSGNLLVGTTSGSAHTLQKDNANDIAADVVNSSSSNCYGLRVRYSSVTPNTAGYYFYRAQDSSANRFEVYSNGGIANYQANNSNLSDRREKTNFAPAGSYLDKICAISVQTFNYIDQSENDPGLTLGVVAQDVQAVAPELVAESNWGTEEEPKMRLSIYQTDLQYALMKCIQEQQAIIESLTTRLAALEAK